MPDLTLHDGREITIDPYAITHKEFTRIVERTTTNEEDDIIIARACGMTAEDVAEMSEKEWRRVTKAVFAKVTTPDPL